MRSSRIKDVPWLPWLQDTPWVRFRPGLGCLPPDRSNPSLPLIWGDASAALAALDAIARGEVLIDGVVGPSSPEAIEIYRRSTPLSSEHLQKTMEISRCSRFLNRCCNHLQPLKLWKPSIHRNWKHWLGAAKNHMPSPKVPIKAQLQPQQPPAASCQWCDTRAGGEVEKKNLQDSNRARVTLAMLSHGHPWSIKQGPTPLMLSRKHNWLYDNYIILINIILYLLILELRNSWVWMGCTYLHYLNYLAGDFPIDVYGKSWLLARHQPRHILRAETRSEPRASKSRSLGSMKLANLYSINFNNIE